MGDQAIIEIILFETSLISDNFHFLINDWTNMLFIKKDKYHTTKHGKRCQSPQFP